MKLFIAGFVFFTCMLFLLIYQAGGATLLIETLPLIVLGGGVISALNCKVNTI